MGNRDADVAKEEKVFRIRGKRASLYRKPRSPLRIISALGRGGWHQFSAAVADSLMEIT